MEEMSVLIEKSHAGAFDLAGDHRHRVGGEFHIKPQIKLVDSLHQPDTPDLKQILRIDVVMAMDAGAEVESIYRCVYQSDGNEIYLADQIATDQTCR